jgi:HK97 family phage major capsid protein
MTKENLPADGAVAADQVAAFYDKAVAQRRYMSHFDQTRVKAAFVGDQAAIDQADADQAKMTAMVQRREGLDIDQVPAKVRTASSTLFSNVRDAYNAGQWIRARFTGAADAQRYCLRHGLVENAMTTWDNTAGGFIVPEPMENTVVALREQYGTIRRNAQNVTLGNGRLSVPRVNTEITSYYVAENSTITPSDPALNQVTLDAKKLAALTTMSSELSEDSVVSIAELLSRSIAYSFALAEDQAGFLGDGTSTYGGIVGLAGAIQAGSRYTATSRATFGALNIGDFESVAGQAKVFGPNRKWYISNVGYYASMQRLMDAVGGVTMSELANGVRQPSFLGYPVEISQVLESRTSGTSGGVACYFGDLSAGAYIGTRRGLQLALDSSRYFEMDMLALRATQRYDIVIHDRGTASASGGLVQMVFG